MALTFKHLINNINSIEEDIKQKVEACRVLAKNHCFEEAHVMAIRIKGAAERLENLFDEFDFKTAEFE